MLDYCPRLLNFGSVLTVGSLEVESCRALAAKPMELLNIRWESPELVERLVVQTVQRANLIATASNDGLYCLDRWERVILARHLDQVLGGARVRDQLPLRDLSTDTGEQVLDRFVVYAAASGELKAKDHITLADIIRKLELHGYTLRPTTSSDCWRVWSWPAFSEENTASTSSRCLCRPICYWPMARSSFSCLSLGLQDSHSRRGDPLVST